MLNFLRAAICSCNGTRTGRVHARKRAHRQIRDAGLRSRWYKMYSGIQVVWCSVERLAIKERIQAMPALHGFTYAAQFETQLHVIRLIEEQNPTQLVPCLSV